MPDLSPKAVHEFWHRFQEPSIYRVIAFMESVEDWTLDGDPAIESAIETLGKKLDQVGEIDLKKEPAFIELVAHLTTGRGLRILMALDQAYPGAAAKVLMYAEENTENSADMAGIFLQRNMIFERMRLLSRMFSPERFKLICSALEEG